MMVRHNGSTHKRYWSPRRPGQIRMTIARRERKRSKEISHLDTRRDKHGKRVSPSKRWPPTKWYVPPAIKGRRGMWPAESVRGREPRAASGMAWRSVVEHFL